MDVARTTPRMEGVLNEITNTVHKHQPGGPERQTECGATLHVGHDRLERVSIDHTIDTTSASKCGRCFSDGNGY